jgi:hypothetical protein
MPRPKKEISISEANLEIAERGHLIRWFHERTTPELKALKKGFVAMQGLKGKKGGGK